MEKEQTDITVKSTPRDFFIYLLSTFTFYVTVINLFQLLFFYIERAYPSFENNFFDWISLARWDIAIIIVMFPVYLYTMIYIHHDLRLHPEKHDMRTRKWFGYLTLFLAVVILLFDVGTLIYHFLEGDLAIRFLLKILTVFIVIGLIFIFYWYDLKQRWANFELQIFFILASIVMVIVIAYGIAIFRPEHNIPNPPKTIIAAPTNIPIKATQPSIPLKNISYCTNNALNASPEETAVLQQLIPHFAAQFNCNMGNNCLVKWNDRGIIKFSVAWLVSQNCTLGQGSTFVCNTVYKNTCCWPLGYYSPNNRVCTETIKHD